MPINVRLPVDPIRECGNRWATLIIDLPVGKEDPIERLKQIRQTTMPVKHPMTKFFFFYLTQVFLHGPKRFLQFLFPYFTNRWSIAISNVYLAPFTINLCGHKLLSALDFVTNIREYVSGDY
jgi:hypothetical protein